MVLKKAAALALSLATLLTFTGCKKVPVDTSSSSSGSSASSSSQPLTPETGAKLTYRTGSTSDLAFAKVAAANFAKQYGVPVTVEQGGLYDTQKMAIEGPTGKGPDVFMAPHDKTADGIKSGLFLPLDSRVVSAIQKIIRPQALKTVTYNGQTYGVPVSIETYVLFYNKKVVTGKPAATFEELAAQAKTFNDPKQNKFLYLFDASTGSPIYTLLSTYGFNLFGKDGTDEDHPGFDTPEYEKGLEVLHAYKSILPVKASDLGNTDFLDTEFIQGKAGYILSGPWDVKSFRDQGVDLGAVGLPTYQGHQERSFGFVQNAHVSAYTKYPAAAQLFAEYLVNSENAELLYQKAAEITARSDIAKIPGLSSDTVLMTIANAFDQSIPMPGVKKISYFWSIATDVGPAVFDGTITPKQGVAKSEQEWNEYSAAS